MNNIMELNKLINAGVELVRYKFGIPLRNKKAKFKTWKGNQIGKTNNNALTRSKTAKQKKNARIYNGHKKGKTTRLEQTIQLEEVNQTISADEGRRKRN